ncbi:unnamed protein product [Mytilus coruscus]|uniref:C1q domain-containing protein n=1 Tax=Mytilus coruscus TaxID=42192 RepID=A0A6J8ENN5_MYTCO|nr:unnamed protein product [Mytilus coruscus]
MAFMVLHGYAIFIFIISLNEGVIANSCENDNCKAAIKLPLITKLNAPLKAELDISGLTTQLKELIGNEVKQAVSVAMKDLAENIMDKRAQSAMENLQTYNNRTISSFLHEMEVKMETNQNITSKKILSLNTMDTKLEKIIEQMKENHMKKLTSIESEATKNSERVAMTAFVPSTTTHLSVGSVVKFSVVKFSVGIGTLSSYINTGKFVCVKSGLYIVSTTVESNHNGAEFHIYVNGKLFTKTYKYDKNGWWHSTSVSIVIELNMNDTVWVQIGVTPTQIRGDLHSSFTIIKIH